MSSPFGWRSAGKSCLNIVWFEGQPAWTAAVIEESIHVSNTSVSPFRLRDPQLGHFSTGGGLVLGSVGSLASSAVIVSLHCWQNHTGIGVPKIRCLDTTQSQSRDRVQSTRRCFANEGTHRRLSDEVVTWFVRSRVFMNH